jgi:hypothetical protein
MRAMREKTQADEGSVWERLFSIETRFSEDEFLT